MNETFGQRFQRIRKAAGLTQEDVATKLNITAQAVSKWENDASAPDISVLLDLADLLKVSVDELLGKQPETKVLAPDEIKNIDLLVLKMRVLSAEGDKVNINLPLALLKAMGPDALSNFSLGTGGKLNIDIEQVIALVEKGIVGKIMDIQSAEGDIVELWVE